MSYVELADRMRNTHALEEFMVFKLRFYLLLHKVRFFDVKISHIRKTIFPSVFRDVVSKLLYFTNNVITNTAYSLPYKNILSAMLGQFLTKN